MSIFDLFKQVESASPAGPPEYLIVGLGNPGLEYAQTRHNAGFMTLDLLAEREHAEIKRMKFKSLCGDAVIAGKRCLLMKPTTYMNNSGQAVAEAMQFYKLPIDHIIVVYDDISLEPSRLRIRRKGSDGGHNGLKSVASHQDHHLPHRGGYLSPDQAGGWQEAPAGLQPGGLGAVPVHQGGAGPAAYCGGACLREHCPDGQR